MIDWILYRLKQISPEKSVLSKCIRKTTKQKLPLLKKVTEVNYRYSTVQFNLKTNRH